jgi:hypothetical protein
MVVRDCKLKDRQYNDQMTKGQTMIYKTTQKTKDWATQKTGVELRWSDTSAHQMICEDRHFTHMLKTLAWPHKTGLLPPLFTTVLVPNDRTVIYACGLNFCRFLIGYQNYSDDLVFFVFHLIVVKTAYYKKYTY